MKLKTLLVVFVTLNIIALSVYGYFWLGARHAKQAAEQSDEIIAAIAFEHSGVASQKDYLELRQIRKRVKSSHSLGSTDFNWLMQFFAKPTLQNTPSAAGVKHIWALGPMLDANLTPAQSDDLYKIAFPMLSSTDKTADDADKVYGCNAMKKLKDKRAIPAILPLLNDPRPMVVKRAQQALDSMGYKAG